MRLGAEPVPGSTDHDAVPSKSSRGIESPGRISLTKRRLFSTISKRTPSGESGSMPNSVRSVASPSAATKHAELDMEGGPGPVIGQGKTRPFELEDLVLEEEVRAAIDLAARYRSAALLTASTFPLGHRHSQTVSGTKLASPPGRWPAQRAKLLRIGKDAVNAGRGGGAAGHGDKAAVALAPRRAERQTDRKFKPVGGSSAMMRVAVLDDYQGVALQLADWKSLHPDAQIEAFPEHIADLDTLAKRLHPFECLVLMRERTPLPRPLIDKLPNLRLVITTGMQNASVDAAALAERGIVFCGTEGVGHATAELTWGLILALLRNIPFEDRSIRQGKLADHHRPQRQGPDHRHHRARAARRHGRGLRQGLRPRHRRLEPQPYRCAGRRARRASASTKDELFRRADIVTIHVGLNPSSRGLVGAAELGLMKPNAYLVNTSRGPIVDQAALVAALKGKRIAGAAIDVYDHEPVGKDHPFFALDNVVLTPHLGYVIEENLRANYANAVENIRAFLDGKPIRLIKPRG